MSLWEYCEVAWTPKQITLHVYSARDEGNYEGILKPEEWGTLLAQLGADGWELVGVMPTRPANHSLYYFKRPLEPPDVVDWKKRKRFGMTQQHENS
jgi:hypothetical protein